MSRSGSNSSKGTASENNFKLSIPRRGFKKYTSALPASRGSTIIKGRPFKVHKPTVTSHTLIYQTSSGHSRGNPMRNDSTKALDWIHSLINRGKTILSTVKDEEVSFQKQLKKERQMALDQENKVANILSNMDAYETSLRSSTEDYGTDTSFKNMNDTIRDSIINSSASYATDSEAANTDNVLLEEENEENSDASIIILSDGSSSDNESLPKEFEEDSEQELSEEDYSEHNSEEDIYLSEEDEIQSKSSESSHFSESEDEISSEHSEQLVEVQNNESSGRIQTANQLNDGENLTFAEKQEYDYQSEDSEERENTHDNESSGKDLNSEEEEDYMSEDSEGEHDMEASPINFQDFMKPRLGKLQPTEESNLRKDLKYESGSEISNASAEIEVENIESHSEDELSPHSDNANLQTEAIVDAQKQSKGELFEFLKDQNNDGETKHVDRESEIEIEVEEPDSYSDNYWKNAEEPVEELNDEIAYDHKIVEENYDVEEEESNIDNAMSEEYSIEEVETEGYQLEPIAQDTLNETKFQNLPHNLFDLQNIANQAFENIAGYPLNKDVIDQESDSEINSSIVPNQHITPHLNSPEFAEHIKHSIDNDDANPADVKEAKIRREISDGVQQKDDDIISHTEDNSVYYSTIENDDEIDNSASANTSERASHVEPMSGSEPDTVTDRINTKYEVIISESLYSPTSSEESVRLPTNYVSPFGSDPFSFQEGIEDANGLLKKTLSSIKQESSSTSSEDALSENSGTGVTPDDSDASEDKEETHHDEALKHGETRTSEENQSSDHRQNEWNSFSGKLGMYDERTDSEESDTNGNEIKVVKQDNRLRLNEEEIPLIKQHGVDKREGEMVDDANENEGSPDPHVENLTALGENREQIEGMENSKESISGGDSKVNIVPDSNNHTQPLQSIEEGKNENEMDVPVKEEMYELMRNTPEEIKGSSPKETENINISDESCSDVDKFSNLERNEKMKNEEFSPEDSSEHDEGRIPETAVLEPLPILVAPSTSLIKSQNSTSEEDTLRQKVYFSHINEGIISDAPQLKKPSLTHRLLSSPARAAESLVSSIIDIASAAKNFMEELDAINSDSSDISATHSESFQEENMDEDQQPIMESDGPMKTGTRVEEEEDTLQMNSVKEDNPNNEVIFQVDKLQQLAQSMRTTLPTGTTDVDFQENFDARLTNADYEGVAEHIGIDSETELPIEGEDLIDAEEKHSSKSPELNAAGSQQPVDATENIKPLMEYNIFSKVSQDDNTKFSNQGVPEENLTSEPPSDDEVGESFEFKNMTNPTINDINSEPESINESNIDANVEDDSNIRSELDIPINVQNEGNDVTDVKVSIKSDDNKMEIFETGDDDIEFIPSESVEFEKDDKIGNSETVGAARIETSEEKDVESPTTKPYTPPHGDETDVSVIASPTIGEEKIENPFSSVRSGKSPKKKNNRTTRKRKRKITDTPTRVGTKVQKKDTKNSKKGGKKKVKDKKK
ncbi:hypothetical protein NCAS_0C01010 [Naumovozyma castellii]|uniref:Uncharacterized protein n=1 Tax=Naumovozyma castellii TaxID=27288 RepID=G0VC82_NAUCA|nr:hypothetical protein NCAS_0C01010 [Naumovozyma castellii CBS 4309]CCC69091.1 hypothetical protein NCAS_0C01010 [Naumovozyma castellii CBS 4309]